MKCPKKRTSVALKQKSTTESPASKFAALTPDELHDRILKARGEANNRCNEFENYAGEELLPLCEEAIGRYKQQGRKFRLNNQPTVKDYFKSIDLNYSTVRGWKRRQKLRTALFNGDSSRRRNKKKRKPLTQLEYALLGAATVGHDLVKALEQHGNVDEAIRDFKQSAPSLEKIEEHLNRQVAPPLSNCWEGLVSKLNALCPSSSDGAQHRIVDQLETAVLTVRAGGPIEPEWAGDQIVFALLEIAATFAAFAKMIDPNLATEFSANPNISNAGQLLEDRLANRHFESASATCEEEQLSGV